jgi:hypothetical protein
MSYSTFISVNITPYKEYKISAPAGVSVYYYGQLVGGAGTANLFVALPGISTLTLLSATSITGSITLTEILRSYYEPYNGQGGVWAFQADLNKWVSQYSFRPEWMCMVGNRLVTFRGGKPFIHTGPYNTFYGQVFDSVVALAHSEAGNTVKTYQSVAIEGDTPDRMHFRTEVPYVQSSDLVASEFTNKEGVKYAGVLRDRLSPNATGTFNDKVMTGDVVRGEHVKAMTVMTAANTKKEIKFIDLQFLPSTGQTV